MKERPILFRGEMVRAILEGRKCMTRRAVKKEISNQFDIDVDNTVAAYINQFTGDSYDPVEICPYGTIGDLLWVRETWYYEEHMHDSTEGMPDSPGGLYSHRLVYKADCPDYPANVGVGRQGWRPATFMPYWASRITLEITGIRVERLQEITECDAEKEGMPGGMPGEYPIAPVYCPECRGEGNIGSCHPVSLGYIEIDCPYCDTAKKKFKNLWDSINGRKPGKAWNDNPWVWVVEFRRGDNV